MKSSTHLSFGPNNPPLTLPSQQKNSFIPIILSLVQIQFSSSKRHFPIDLALDNLGFGTYKTDCLNAMETAQEEIAQKRKKLQGKPTSIYSQEELRRQQELLFEQVRISFLKERLSLFL